VLACGSDVKLGRGSCPTRTSEPRLTSAFGTGGPGSPRSGPPSTLTSGPTLGSDPERSWSPRSAVPLPPGSSAAFASGREPVPTATPAPDAGPGGGAAAPSKLAGRSGGAVGAPGAWGSGRPGSGSGGPPDFRSSDPSAGDPPGRWGPSCSAVGAERGGDGGKSWLAAGSSGGSDPGASGGSGRSGRRRPGRGVGSVVRSTHAPSCGPPGGRPAQPIGAEALPRRPSTTWAAPIPPAAAEG
jgi:hypothetical protein